jgi:hypothetical protein
MNASDITRKKQDNTLIGPYISSINCCDNYKFNSSLILTDKPVICPNTYFYQGTKFSTKSCLPCPSNDQISQQTIQ